MTLWLIIICWLVGSVPAAVVVGTILRVRREEMDLVDAAWHGGATPPVDEAIGNVVEPARPHALAGSVARAEAQYWSTAEFGPLLRAESRH